MKLPFWPNPKGYRDINLGLDRAFEILNRIGNPHEKLPPVIHFAGTNGKGSTLSFIKSILQESDFKIHAYTSPHLVNFNERIILADHEISDEFLNECLKECEAACALEPKIEPTYFEGITIAAFLAFSRVEADFLLLETGMGGRLDATNVIAKNLCSIITPISLDHTEFLGDSIAKIAYEKACIIKDGCAVFVAKQADEARKVIAQKSDLAKFFGQDFSIKIHESSFDLIEKNGFEIKAIAKPEMFGSHQIENAALAVYVVLKIIGFDFYDREIFNRAIKKTKWKARLEKIESGKLLQKLPKNCELFLDGSHNLSGASTICEFLKNHANQKKILIFAMLKDKDCSGFLQKIKDEIDVLIALPIADEDKSRSAQEISEIAIKAGVREVFCANDFAQAFELLRRKFTTQKDRDNLILICGSLYSAGDFLKKNTTK